MLPFPVYIVNKGSLRADIINRRNSTGQRFAAVPWFQIQPNGKKGMGRRQCTHEYKIQPINQMVRQLLQVEKGKRVPKNIQVEMWIGISTDEIERVSQSRHKYIQHRWPLIEAGMSRRDCEKWLMERQYKAPKSACIGCPFHSNAMWRDMRDNDPESWADAVAVDRELRANPNRKMRAVEFMHRSCVPLDQAPIDLPEPDADLFGFNNECQGMCGV